MMDEHGRCKSHVLTVVLLGLKITIGFLIVVATDDVRADDCERGMRQVHGRCLAIQVPENGELDYTGNDWQCKRGFRRAVTSCVAIQLPTNAEVDYTGNDWQCKRGFRKAVTACVALQLPTNAEVDYTGNDWQCKRGFRKSGSQCVVMSEKQRREQDRAIALAHARAQRLNEASCEIDGKAAVGDHAEVIIQKSGCGDYFIADGPNGDYLLEGYGGYSPSEGDIIIGPIDSSGFKDVCYPDHGEGRVYVDDYGIGRSTSQKKYAEKCR